MGNTRKNIGKGMEREQMEFSDFALRPPLALELPEVVVAERVLAVEDRLMVSAERIRPSASVFQA